VATALIETEFCVYLAIVLFCGILTLWVQARWALTLFQLALFGIAAVRLFFWQRTPTPFRFHPVVYLLATAAAWGVMQILSGQTVYSLRTIESVLNWTANLAAFAVALELGRTPQARERFLQSALGFTALLSLLAVFTALTSPAGILFWRFDATSHVPTLGPFIYKNQYAAFVEAILPFAVWCAIRDRRRWLPFTLLSALLFGSVVASGSRAGSILCLLEIIVVPILARLRGVIGSRTLARAVLGSLGAVVLFTAIVGGQTLWARLQEPNPYALRWDLVQSSIAMVRDRPWTGFGLGTWPDAYPGYARYDDGTFVNQAHNDWLQWAAEGGIPFLLLMTAVAVWTIRPSVSSLWGIGLLAVFLHALIDYPLQQRPALAAYFFALLGILASTESFTGSSRPVAATNQND
jgi:O-antigen ligase